MTDRFEKMPQLEDLIGAGMELPLAMSFEAYMLDENWDAFRAWTFLLKRETNSFQKLSIDELSAHVRDKVGNVSLPEVGQ